MKLRPGRRTLWFIFFALVGLAAWRLGWYGVFRVPLAVVEPGRSPDRIILTWNGDPASSQAVVWRTSTAIKSGVAEIAPAEDGPLFVKRARRVTASLERLETDAGPAHYHAVEFSDLEPDSTYVYRVGDGEVWSEWNQFSTLSDKSAPLKFLYVGDAQNDIFSMWSRLIREGYSKAPEADFIVHAGDLVNRADRDAEWGDWHRAAGWIFRRTPSVPAAGNHEYLPNSRGGRSVTPHWRPQFALPTNGPADLEETCYFLDLPGLRLVVLNSNEGIERQAAWLDGLLADNPHRWTVVVQHHPIFSLAGVRDNPELRAALQPIYDNRGVDLVLQGHDHAYGRGNAPGGASGRVGETVYVVSVSGPKMYGIDQRDWPDRGGEDIQLFQVIEIDGERLSYRAYTAVGRLYDAFDIEKREGEPKRVIDRAPATPENRRR